MDWITRTVSMLLWYLRPLVKWFLRQTTRNIKHLRGNCGLYGTTLIFWELWYLCSSSKESYWNCGTYVPINSLKIYWNCGTCVPTNSLGSYWNFGTCVPTLRAIGTIVLVFHEFSVSRVLCSIDFFSFCLQINFIVLYVT